MTKSRLEAFSDGVIAIIITIMVLELKAPHEASWRALVPLAPVLLSYLLSFIFLGIYWSNHHHLLQAVEQVDGRVRQSLDGNLSGGDPAGLCPIMDGLCAVYNGGGDVAGAGSPY